ncbi:MAG: hypothetical protein CMP63_08535 [Flavobacteriales bacterium]|nr:hypothetical protein [Flavobacteriales bacterium]
MKEFKLFLIGLCSLTALFSCKKDDANIGAYLSEAPNKIVAEIVDSFYVTTYSGIEDSIITSGRISPMLGTINSTELGIAKSSLFASLIPDSLDRFFPSSDFNIDSFYIQFHIIDVYGKNINQEFEIFKINEPIDENSTYYNFDTITVGEKLGSITLNISDSGIYKYNLDSSAAHYLFSNINSSYESNEAFKSFFAGIYISPSTNPYIDEGAIYKLNKTGISLHLSFSTTNGTDNQYDTDLVYMVENEQNIFARFTHDYTNAEVNSIFTDSTLGQNAYYVQGLAGVYGKIEFPTLQKWFNNDSINYLITDFEFTIYVADNSTFTLPDQLFLTYTSSAGLRTYKSAMLNSEENSYRFEISNSEINTSLENGMINDLNFEISHPFSGSSPEQVKIFGGNSETPPILKISYTSY